MYKVNGESQSIQVRNQVICHFPCTILSCVQYETSVWKIFSFNDIAHNNLLNLGPGVTKRQCKLIRIQWKEWQQFTFCSSGMNFMDDCYPTCLYELFSKTIVMLSKYCRLSVFLFAFWRACKTQRHVRSTVLVYSWQNLKYQEYVLMYVVLTL